MLVSRVCVRACPPRLSHSGRLAVRSATSPPKDQSVRFGFSAGGLLFPFYIGVCRGLEQAGYLSPETKLAGASAGSLIAACVNSGLSMDTVTRLCEDLMEDCREHGTRGRLGIVLERFLQSALPEDAHIRCTGKTFVAVSSVESSSGKGLGMFGNFGTPTGQLVSDFADRDDLIDALMTYVGLLSTVCYRLCVAFYRARLREESSHFHMYDLELSLACPSGLATSLFGSTAGSQTRSVEACIWMAALPTSYPYHRKTVPRACVLAALGPSRWGWCTTLALHQMFLTSGRIRCPQWCSGHSIQQKSTFKEC